MTVAKIVNTNTDLSGATAQKGDTISFSNPAAQTVGDVTPAATPVAVTTPAVTDEGPAADEEAPDDEADVHTSTEEEDA